MNEEKVTTKRFVPRPTLSQRHKEELGVAFGEFDPRGSGMIETRNYVIALRAMGFEPKIEKVQTFIDETIGTAGKDWLDFKEFYRLMSLKMLGEDNKAELNKMYKLFAKDESEGITLENLIAIAKELQEDISQEELKEMIAFADDNKDDRVSFEEFVKIMETPKLE